tara:strand:- start:314 stop:430 length:117 start_codon:yes stop_codon:yes gene_type:complete
MKVMLIIILFWLLFKFLVGNINIGEIIGSGVHIDKKNN